MAIKFVEAAEIYGRSPAALRLRAMNIIYETIKERGATTPMPSAMVNSMNPGGVMGLLAALQPPMQPGLAEGGERAMRRLDWVMAGIVAACLVAVAVFEASSWSLAGFERPGSHGQGPGEATLRRIVSHVPNAPIFGGDAR